MNESIVSIVADAYLFPIADLSSKLFSDLTLSQNDVQASQLENGYASSLCILTAVWFESYAMRVRYLNSQSPHGSIKEPVSFIKALYPDFPLYDEMMEVFVLRDTLAHNHLWMIEFEWDDTGDMKLNSAVKDAFSGDKKYRHYVDSNTRRTKTLKLNVVPTRVCNSDFKIVLKTVFDALWFVRTKDPAHIGFGNAHPLFKGQFVSLSQFVDQIQKHGKPSA